MRLLTDPMESLPRSLHLPVSLRVSTSRQISAQQLAVIAKQIQNKTREAEALIFARSERDLNARIERNSWSVAECFDHLAQTTNAFLPAILKVLADTPVLKTDRTLRTGALAQLFIWNLEPPYRIRLKVLPQLMPQNRDLISTWQDFITSQARLLEAINSATGLAIDKVKIKSPVYARFSYNIYGAFRMLATHQRRHLWQIEQIFAALDRDRSSKDTA